MFKIVFFVPESHLEPVKNALFKAGAGQSNHYSIVHGKPKAL